MEEIEKRRVHVRRHFKNLESKVQMLLDEDPADIQKILAAFRVFMDNYNILADLDSRALERCFEDNLEAAEVDAEMETASEYRKKAELIALKVETVSGHTARRSLPTTEDVNNDTGSLSEDRRRTFQLPNVEIKPFKGDLLDWLRFWSQFKKIHEDDQLHASDKFWYLTQFLAKDSEPSEIISTYPQDDQNYQLAVDALKRKYGDEDFLLQVYIRELLKLVTSNVNSKEKIPLPTLYLKLDSHLRSLKLLNLERADPATWLFPLVESSLPDEVLYNWQRNSLSSYDGSQEKPPKTRLDLLMTFMEKEVQIKQRIDLAKSFVHEQKESHHDKKMNTLKRPSLRKPTATLSGFHVGDTRRTCVFCDKTNHSSNDCLKARNMTHEEKIAILSKKRLCYRCFGFHTAKTCRANYLNCGSCKGKHFTIICNKKKEEKETEPQSKRRRTDNTSTSMEMSNMICTDEVCLQTLMVTIANGRKKKVVRALLDSGSQRSYLTKRTAEEMGLEPVLSEVVMHSVFGGDRKRVVHSHYYLTVGSLSGEFEYELKVRDQEKICDHISRTRLNSVMKQELEAKGITLSDVGNGCPAIELLIGADSYGYLLTGNVTTLLAGPTVVETKLGWTLIGELSETPKNSIAMLSLAMTVSEATLSQFWDLENLGIKDPIEVETTEQLNLKIKTDLVTHMTRDKSGRYEVCLPWKEGHPPLPHNREVAIKRLETATKKLEAANLFDNYGKLFRDWEMEGFIDRVCSNDSNSQVHYLPHRPVIKPGSLTTPVRPVFDCSCRTGHSPSLNDCLYKGPNYILKIPEILIGFREKSVGFTSDIRKAFQMIGIAEKDRNYLRFLWWKDATKKEMITYQHARLPFGATCSPFILGAVLEHHLTNLPNDRIDLGKRIFKTLYVDNCVHSESTFEEYKMFREASIALLGEAGMELRMWFSNKDEFEDESTHKISVLGLLWDRKEDVLMLDASKLVCPTKLTKRVLLSTVQKIFDPIGFSVPATILVKMLIQQTWACKLKWDDDLPEVQKMQFQKWISGTESLGKIKIPRVVTGGISERKEWSIHVMTDASQAAYAAVVFLRVKLEGKVVVQLLMAKAKVAPLKAATIPRLELMGCLIGARLYNTVRGSLNIEGVKTFFWSDSVTALAWIRRNDSWGTFVGRRTEEIRKLTLPEDWRHLPGQLNPADLPSRGCTPKELLDSKWWEGPDWLYEEEEAWPKSDEKPSEEEIFKEVKKTQVVTMAASVIKSVKAQHSFYGLVRITGWCKRFLFNASMKDKSKRQTGPLSLNEIREAEAALVRSIQQEAFGENIQESVKGLELLKDDQGIIRIKTRLTYRNDKYSFKYPVVLPGWHDITRQLIMDFHTSYCHAGVGFVMTKLRNKYWIIRMRRNVKAVISRCFRCRKLSAKATVMEIPPLPEDRVKDAQPFEVTGVDLAGPLILKNGKKAWIVIFTCAVYRAVHFEIVQSLSTNAFIGSLKQFINKYRRPAVIYSDNGTNFRGADHLFRRLDWDTITKNEGVKRIQWKFSCSAAPWHGGWWERLIRTAKDLMRRMIGNSCVNRNELETILIVLADVMNERPLTYVSEDPNDLEPLTPMMFIRPYGNARFPEVELINGGELRSRYSYIKKLTDELKGRWRKDYLSMMVSKLHKPTRKLKEGELVIVSQENKKRHEWPLARILKLFPNREGNAYIATIKTSEGTYNRPVQRLHPLEMDWETKTDNAEAKKIVTRFGRVVKPVKRL